MYRPYSILGMRYLKVIQISFLRMYDRIFGIPCAETRGIFEKKLSDLGIG